MQFISFALLIFYTHVTHCFVLLFHECDNGSHLFKPDISVDDVILPEQNKSVLDAVLNFDKVRVRCSGGCSASRHCDAIFSRTVACQYAPRRLKMLSTKLG